MRKETKISKQGFEYSVFDNEECRTVEAVLEGWTDVDQFELEDPKYILDLGANVGVWAFLQAKKYPNAKVVAVEAIKETYSHLHDGVAFNGLTNVVPIHIAVSDSEVGVVLKYGPMNSGAASQHLPQDELYREEFCPSMTLNTFFESCLQFDLVKADVEGSEYQIFKDFKYWDKIKRMTIEFHPWPQFESKEEQEKKTNELITLLIDKLGRENLKFIYPQLHEEKFGG